MAKRRGICARVVSRLERDGALSPGLKSRDAVDILWALLGSRVHEDLVVARGWSRKRYERQLRAILRSALLKAS
jgi:hypothetical protein